jgi:hypothetical protein
MQNTIPEAVLRSSIDWHALVRRLPANLRPSRVCHSEPDTSLEVLVALAIAAIRQADDTARQAAEISRRARRGKFALGLVGGLGFAVGIAGISFGHGTAVRPALDALEVRLADGIRPDGPQKPAPALFVANRILELPPVTPQAAAEAIPAAVGSFSQTGLPLAR